MKKGNLISTIAFIFSIMLLIVSGAIFVYSATQQSVSSSLQVTFSGENVDFTVQGWYHVKGDSNKVAMVNSSGQTSGITFSATDAPKTETLKISNTESENKAILTATEDYVLFTYKFVNTASDGAFGMEVTLNLTNVTGSNLKAVKCGTADSLYADADLDDVCEGLSTFSTQSGETMKIFDNEFIVAGGNDANISGTGIYYYYVLLQLDDPTLPVTFNPIFNWTVECSSNVTEPDKFNISGAILESLTEYGQTRRYLAIPNTVTTLGTGAFDNVNPNLTSLTIPSSVTTIEVTALQHVQFDTIHLTGAGWAEDDDTTDAFVNNKAKILDEIKVAAGYYPQTYVGDTLNTTLIDANLSSSTGSYNKVDVNGTERTLYEYTVGGVKYAKLEANQGQLVDSATFSTGDTAAVNKDLFFLVEPIVVTIKTVSNTGECYFLADKLLGSRRYDSSIANWYSSPALRTYLNGTFMTDTGLSSHLTTTHTVYNNEPGSGSNVQETSNDTTNTSDYIWLPSFYEMMNGGGLGYTQNSDRLCEATDLAVATYTWVSRFNNTNYGAYFQRSAGTSASSIGLVGPNGNVSRLLGPNNSHYGFRVAFAFNL